MKARFYGNNSTKVDIIVKNGKAVLAITGNKRGFETILNFTTDKLQDILATMSDESFDRISTKVYTFDRVKFRHKELTRALDEAEASTKYFSGEATIDFVHAGDMALITIYSLSPKESRTLVTISCNIYDLQKSGKKIIAMIKEAEHREWLS